MEYNAINIFKRLQTEFVSTFAMLRVVLFRFAPVLMFCVFGTSLLVYITYQKPCEIDTYMYLYHYILTSALAALAFLAIRLAVETYFKVIQKRLILLITVCLLLFIYYSTLDAKISEVDMNRFGVLLIASGFLIFFSGFAFNNNNLQHWQFLRAITVRAIFSGIFTVIIFAGISLALWSIENLFSVIFAANTYLRVWIILAGIFFPFFFLAGIPYIDDFESYHHRNLPLIRVFSKYILGGLLLIYLIILYVYIGKILFTLSLPSGWVSILVSCFAALAILFKILVIPFKDEPNEKFARTFAYWLDFLLILPVVLMLIAAIQRYNQYGITEMRYFLFLWILWLFIYMGKILLTKKISLRFLTFSIFLMLVLSVIGPWSAFSISKNSQIKRLENLFVKEQLFTSENKLAPKQNYNNENAIEIMAVIEYLANSHDLKDIAKWIPDTEDSLKVKLLNADAFHKNAAYDLLTFLNINNSRYYKDKKPLEKGYFNYFTLGDDFINVEGFQYVLPLNLYETYTNLKDTTNSERWNEVNMKLEKDTVKIILAQQRNELVLYRNLIELFRLQLAEYIAGIDTLINNKQNEIQESVIPNNYASLQRENESVKMKVIFKTISGKMNLNKDSIKIQSLQADILLKFKDEARK